MTALGVALLIFGAIVIAVEAHVPTLGALGVPGIVFLAIGALLAVLGLGGGVILGVVTAAVLAGVSVGVLTVTLREGLAVRRRRVRAGPESMIGHVGVIRSWSERAGKVQVDGELWRARLSSGVEDEEEHGAFHEGDPVVVEYRHGLTLSVRRAEDWELTP